MITILYDTTFTCCEHCSIIPHAKKIKALDTVKSYDTWSLREVKVHVNSLWILVPRNGTHFSDSGSAKQAVKEISQRNSKALHFSEIDIRCVQYWYRSVSDMPFGIWQIMKSAPCAIGKRTRTHSFAFRIVCSNCLSRSDCFQYTYETFSEISIPVNIGGRGGEMNVGVGGGGGTPPQNAPSSNFSPSALIVLQLSLFSSAVHLTVNIITGLDRTSVNSIPCSV